MSHHLPRTAQNGVRHDDGLRAPGFLWYYRGHDAVRARQLPLTMLSGLVSAALPASLFLGQSILKVDDTPSAPLNNACELVQGVRWVLRGVVAASAVTRLHRLDKLYNKRESVASPGLLFLWWLAPFVLIAAAVSNPAYAVLDETTRVCRLVRQPGFWPFSATAVHLLPIAVVPVFLYRVRAVQDPFGVKNAAVLNGSLLMIYTSLSTISYFAPVVSQTPLLRACYTMTLIALHGTGFWAYAGGALLTIFEDPDREVHRRAEPSALALELSTGMVRPSPAREVKRAAGDPTRSIISELGEMLGAIPRMRMSSDAASSNLPAVTQARPFQAAVLDHYLQIGMLMPAMMEFLSTSMGTTAFERFLALEVCSHTRVV